jgi:hypothetical protein
MWILTFVGNWLYNWIIGLGGIGALISIAAWLLWYFTPSFLSGSKNTILHVAVVATAITVASTYLSAHYYDFGFKTAMNLVAKQNKEAADAVKKVTTDVDNCFDSGGTFDNVNGVCKR